MSNQVDKPAAVDIALKVSIILAEIIFGFIVTFGVVLVFGLLLNAISVPAEVSIFVVFLLLIIVPSIVVYLVGKKIGKHQGSYLFVLLGSGLVAVILLDIVSPILLQYLYETIVDGKLTVYLWGILAGIPVIGAIVGFYVKKEEKKVSKKVVGLALAGVIVVGLIGYAAIDIYATTAFRTEIQRIKEKGEPVGFEDFAEVAVSNEQNSAPIYREIFSLLDASCDESGKPSQEMVKVREVDNIDFNKWTEKQKQEIPVILAKYNRIFELMHKASLKPRCNFNIDYTFNEAFDKFFSVERMGGIRNNISLLSAKSALDKEDGRIEEAVERIHDGFAMAMAFGTTKFLISSLAVRLMNKLMLDRLEMLLADRDISLQSYQRLYDTLKKQRLGETDFLISFYAERCRIIKLIKQPQLLKSNLWNWPFETFSILHAPRYLAGVRFLKDELDRAIEMIKKPYWEIKDKKTTLGATSFAFRISDNLNYFSSVNARFGNAELATALRIYRDKTGTYPASLKELTPDIVQKLPVDPYTGKDFVYRREGKGFIVYSLCENAKDDQGKQDDIVWKSVI
jgi:hypothetical protein